MIAGGNVTTSNINTPVIIVGDGSTAITLLSAQPNNNRLGFSIQNVGTTAALIRIGGPASATVYHYSIKGGTADNDGTGGSITLSSGVIPQGIVTLFGASTAKCTCLEIAP